MFGHAVLNTKDALAVAMEFSECGGAGSQHGGRGRAAGSDAAGAESPGELM
jgi:hypothetical protein